MSWEEYRKQAKMSEEKKKKNLIDPIWANDYENMKEHWDVKGVFKNKTYRFDVKGMFIYKKCITVWLIIAWKCV